MWSPLLSLFLLSCDTPTAWTRAYEIENLSQTIGGPKALARPGDFIIENDKVRFAVLGNRPSMGNHTDGGSLLDADLQRTDSSYAQGHGADRLGEVFASINLKVAAIGHEEGVVKILSDGSDGGDAVICTVGEAKGFISLLQLASGLLGDFDQIRTDYILSPGRSALLIRTYVDTTGTLSCDGDPPESTPVQYTETPAKLIEMITNGGLALGDFTLFGGGLDVFVPGIGFDESGYVNELGKLGVNTFVDPILADFLGATSPEVSYAFMADGGVLSVPMFTGSQTAGFGGFVSASLAEAGGVFHYDRWLAVGRGDIGSAVDGLMAATGKPAGAVSGQVVERGTGIALPGVHVFAYRAGAEGPWTEWTTDVGNDPTPDGSFGGYLPPGQWELVVHAEGRPTGTRVPITVSQDHTTTVVLESPRPGSVTYSVVDETGRPVPSKVSFFATNGDPVRRPDLGDGHIGGYPAQVVFAAHGSGHVILPPGHYYAVASRGIEYELDISAPFRLTAQSTVDLQLQVVRSVDTTGWISADFHVHAMPSPDSGVSLQDRVLTFAAEGVEFLASSDHDAITDYQPVIEQMGLERWLSSAPGIEVTTLELGHFLGFPLLWDPLADQGGALDWTGLTPGEILDGIRDLGAPEITEPVVFIAHPRDGMLGYFDQYGFDPYGGSVGAASAAPSQFTQLANPLITATEFTLNVDAMEILNAKRFEMIRTPTAEEVEALIADPSSVSIYDVLARTMDEQDALSDGIYTLGPQNDGPIDDWFALLNLGYRITALGNSDTHSKTKTEAGCPRNYVMVPTDDPGLVATSTIADAVREGRVVASYGPFIRFSANEWDNGPGSTVHDPDEVSFYIEVQSPSWFDVDRVELYENGTLIHEWAIEAPNEDTINLATEVLHTPAKDSWYVVIALGDDDLSPVFTPVDIMPIQLQDIVEGAVSEIDFAGFDLSGVLGAASPVPRTFPVYPYAVTNPIWIDKDGDGFDPPGRAPWLTAPSEEEE
jgi:hypothetical protein